MKHKKLKRLCGLLLAAVLVGSSFMQYTGVVRAEGNEPSYDAGTCDLLYSSDSMTMEQGSQSLGNVTVSASEIYYISFTAQTKGEIYFDYRGTNTSRIYLGQTQYALLGASPADIWSREDIGLSTGAKITLKSTPDKTTIWVNGVETNTDVPLVTTGEQGIPKISWASTETTFSDIKVWTEKVASDEPVYNPETDTMKYEAASESVSAKSAGKSWDVTIPENQTYYLSFKVKTTDNLYFNYRGGQARILFGTSQYGLIGLESEVWNGGDFGLSEGVKITLRSDSDKTTFWLNGKKIVEDAALSSTATGLKGIPWVSWAEADAILSDIQVWTAKDGSEEPPVSDEPVYNPETDTMKYKETEITMESVSKDFGVTIPADTTYFGSFTVQTAGEVYFDYRGTDDQGGRLYLGQTQCGFIGLAETNWPQGDRGLSTTGIKVTFRSEPDKTTIWINGEKLADNATLAEGKAGLVGAPKISWASATTTITNIAIWKIKDANDEPVYEETKDKLYDITGEADGCTYEGGVLTVPAQTNAEIQTELPSNAAYYMTMQVNTSGAVNVMTRNDSYICLQSSGYTLQGTNTDGWVESGLFSKLATGVKITLYSDTVGFKMWVDGEKAIEAQYSAENSSAKPNISWSFNSEVTASNIQIWTLNVANLEGHSITLYGNIGVNFYMSLGTAVIPENAVMKFTLPDGSTQQVTGVSTDKGYQYTCEVAAKEMTKEIKAQVVAGDAVSKEYTYSVKDYADTILDKPDKYGDVIPLVKAMLNYGAYAQTYFEYNTEALANAGLSETDVSSVTATTLKGFAKDAQSNEIAGLAGASLILESETTLKLYFTLPAGAAVENYTFSMGNETLTPMKSGTYYYVAIQNIDAKNLDKDYTVTVKCGESTFDVTYSPMTYCYNVLNGSYGDELMNVVRALYLYNSAANDYFGA